MVDLLDNTTRSPNPDVENDDPLAELARIIGYERPAQPVKTTEEEPDASALDLEAELMRELDVPQAVEPDEPAYIPPDSPLDASLEQQADEFAIAESWDEDDGGDLPVWDYPEASASEPVSEELDDEFAFDTSAALTLDEPLGPDDDLSGVWDRPEVDAGLDEAVPEEINEPEPVEPIQEEFGQVIVPDFGAGRQDVTADNSDDTVLADMFRFDVPTREQAIAQFQTGQASVPETDETGDAGSFDETSAFEVGFSGDLEGTDADMVDDRSGFEAVPGDMQTDESVTTDAPAETALDFEAYLSTELDVFEHEVAMSDADDAGHVSGETFQPEARAGMDSEPAPGEWTAAGRGDHLPAFDEAAVFDEAAEELLAADDDLVPQPEHAADDFTESWSVDSIEDAGAKEDNWSVDAIEDAVAEELDEELEDLYGLPEPLAEPLDESLDEADEFELDIEQVLAETVVESDAALAAPAEMTPDPASVEDRAEMADWRLEDVVDDAPADGDEMADAFRGLVPEPDDLRPEPDFASGPIDEPELSHAAVIAATAAVEPAQEDWLSGFDAPEPTIRPDGDDYYFDANLISEPEDRLEPVAYIDVPELVHDEPLSVEPEYDTEIEREFADIVDRHEKPTDADTAAVASDFGSTEGWGRAASTSRGSERSSDYIELERELGVDHDHLAPEHGATGYDDAALTGVESTQDEFLYDDTDREAGSRGPVLALVVLGLALLAGAGAFGWSMLSGDETSADGGPRIIRADTDPVKVLPENPGGVTVPNQDKAVYDRVAGGDGTPAGQPALVNSAEEPVDVVQRTLDPEILPLEGRGDVPAKSEERLVSDGSSADSGAIDAAPPVVSPRKVRTMIVKPDGSIVARADPDPQPEAIEPVAEQAAVGTPEPMTPTMQLSQPDPADAATPAAETTAPAGEVPANTSIAPVRVVTTQPISPVTNAPVPQGRPADQPVNVVGTVTQGGTVANAPVTPTGPVTPAATAQPVDVATAPAAAAPAANPGGYYMQIASQPSAEGAQASWNTLSNRYSSVLGGLGVDIQRADIPGKGVFHRVRVPAGSRDQANALCSRYKAAGGSCFVSR